MTIALSVQLFLFLDGLGKLLLSVDVNGEARGQQDTKDLQHQQANAHSEDDVEITINERFNSINTTGRVDVLEVTILQIERRKRERESRERERKRERGQLMK